MIEMNRQLFDDYAIFGEKPVMVQFYAPNCSYCKRIEHVMEDLSKHYGDKLIMGRFNVNSDFLMMKQEQIEAIPTMVIYKNGAALSSIVAPESRENIEEFIKEGIDGKAV